MINLGQETNTDENDLFIIIKENIQYVFKKEPSFYLAKNISELKNVCNQIEKNIQTYNYRPQRTNTFLKIQCNICSKIGHDASKCWNKEKTSYTHHNKNLNTYNSIPHQTVHINNVEIDALFDSGCYPNIISKKLAVI